jgi:hypothetical protein
MRACVRACVRARRALWAACARAHSETLLSSGPLKNPAASRCAAVQPRYLNTSGLEHRNFYLSAFPCTETSREACPECEKYLPRAVNHGNCNDASSRERSHSVLKDLRRELSPYFALIKRISRQNLETLFILFFC